MYFIIKFIGNKSTKLNPPFFGGSFYFLDFFVVFLTDTPLYSRYNATMHAYATNADTAVIKPEINPSEKMKNNTAETAKTTVYPRFCDKTFNNFSIYVSPFCLDINTISHTHMLFTRKKTTQQIASS